jgi:hypothetical protein
LDRGRPRGRPSSFKDSVLAPRFGGDLTGPEIAELLGLSLSNVQQILSRSLRRLRRAGAFFLTIPVLIPCPGSGWKSAGRA